MDNELLNSPGIKSIHDAGKNIYNAFNLGWDKKLFTPNIKSIGGALTTFGGPIAGAIAGAAIGSQLEGEGAITGAAVGAVAGTLALPAIGLATNGLYYGGKALGKAAFAGGSALYESGVVGKVGSAIGGTLLKSASGIGDLSGVLNPKTANIVGNMFSPLRRNVNAVTNFSKKLINYENPIEKLSDLKLSKLGTAMMVGTGVVEGFNKMINTVEKYHMGNMMPEVKKATPNIPSYLNNAGATGDLVFALNKNRRG